MCNWECTSCCYLQIGASDNLTKRSVGSAIDKTDNNCRYYQHYDNNVVAVGCTMNSACESYDHLQQKNEVSLLSSTASVACVNTGYGYFSCSNNGNNNRSTNSSIIVSNSAGSGVSLSSKLLEYLSAAAPFVNSLWDNTMFCQRIMHNNNNNSQSCYPLLNMHRHSCRRSDRGVENNKLKSLFLVFIIVMAFCINSAGGGKSSTTTKTVIYAALILLLYLRVLR